MYPCPFPSPNVLPYPPVFPLSQSIVHPTYSSLLTCSSPCCRITCVPQPHHVHVAPLAMHRWYQGWAHPTAVTAGTAGSAPPAPPACRGGRDPHVQQDPANWSNADSWGLRLWGHLSTGTQASRRPTDLWGPLFIEKLDTAKKQGVLVNIKLNNVSLCYKHYMFKLTHRIQ